MRDFRSFEFDLIAELSTGIASEDVDSFPASRLSNASLLASMWQKAIRRSDEGAACMAAAALYDLDEQYVWRRVRSIALEDVSVANLALVAQIVAVSSKASLLRKLGAKRALLHVTRSLARSPKCRTGCELMVWRSALASQVDVVSVDDLRTIQATAFDEVVLGRNADAWLSTENFSVRKSGVWTQVNRGCAAKRQFFLEAIGASSLVEYVTMKASRTDRLNTMVPLVDQLMRVKSSVVESPISPGHPMEVIGGYPAYSYCLFSKPGRAAFREVLRFTRWGRQFAELGVGNPVYALGSLVFYVEGGCCDRTLQVAHWSKIRSLSRITQLGQAGIPAAHVSEFLDAVFQDLPTINWCRRKVSSESQDGRLA